MPEPTDPLSHSSRVISLAAPRSGEIDSGWRAEFASEVDQLFNGRLRIAASVLFILHLAAFAVFPDRTGTALGVTLRVAMFPFSAALIACTWWTGLGRMVRAAATLMIVTVCAYAAWNNTTIGEPLDIRSLTLTILTAGLLFPFGAWGMFALSASVLAIYCVAIGHSGELGQAAASGVFFLVCACALATLTAWLSTRLRASEFHARRKLKIANEEMDTLLRDMLPEPIVARLRRERGVIADRHAEATVMFADIVGFTAMSSTLQPELLVRFLNSLFSELDALTTKLGLEKIKTIGDAYMVAAGLPLARPDHAQAVARLALEMRALVSRVAVPSGDGLKVRIGIHSGPVVAGVIGVTKLSYDLWGDTVNIASRMESHAEPGMIQVTEATHDLLKGAFRLEPRGPIQVKGKGVMNAFLLIDELPAPEAGVLSR
jgi:class 3 adenylate cyclase